MNTYKTVDEYIDAFPQKVKGKLIEMRRIIKKAAPEAGEKISYQIPTFVYHGNLVHFGGFKNHVSFFLGGSPVEVFKKELTGYKTSKGTIQFSLDEPLPAGLIIKIVKYRLKENGQ